MLTSALLVLALAQTPQHRLFLQPNLPRTSFVSLADALQAGDKAVKMHRSNDGNMDLWLKQIGSPGEPIRLTNSKDIESQPSFSPDGNSILFRSSAKGGSTGGRSG